MATTLGLNKPAFQAGDALVIVGLNRSYTAESRVGIPRQWEQFVPQTSALPGLVGKTFYGVCWNTKPNCEFDYLTGAEVTESMPLPPEFTTLKIIGRRYAVFAHTGHVSTLPKTIDVIWSKWVPNCGLKIADVPCFERYTADFNPGTGLGGMELWIPLQDSTSLA